MAGKKDTGSTHLSPAGKRTNQQRDFGIGAQQPVKIRKKCTSGVQCEQMRRLKHDQLKLEYIRYLY